MYLKIRTISLKTNHTDNTLSMLNHLGFLKQFPVIIESFVASERSHLDNTCFSASNTFT